MDMQLDPVIAMMRQAHGLDIFQYAPTFLEQSLEKRRAATLSPDGPAYFQRLAQDRAEAEALQQSLFITYSEFFRNPLTFALLEMVILPSLVEARGPSGRTELRLWSAGCAAGQEAYSLAILLDELAQTRGQPVPFRIFATDRSETELSLARAGVYDAAATAKVGRQRLQQYFSRQGETYHLAQRLKDQVDFSQYDLLDPQTTCPPASIYGDFDLIFCSNVLLYYRPETQRVIVNKTQRCLAPGGYFVTGETERQVAAGCGGFRAVPVPAAAFTLEGCHR
jgi:chemotaxis protein methyltransferase CheR